MKDWNHQRMAMTLQRFLKPRFLIVGVALIALFVGSYFVFGTTSGGAAGYKFVTLTKGDLESTISSSGTLSPVTQVEVGTQVSGTIDKILVDFNDKVKKDQVIAILDTSLLRFSVTDAQSGFLKAQAALEEAELNFKRSTELSQKGMLAEADFQPVKTALKNAQASMTMAQSALERAKQNLTYAIIRSPINGTVTARNVEAGQTVAASFSTPTLFNIAQDLSKMEIKALVDESDIGSIKEGQSVRFTVQAYPRRKFEGIVKQVRVQPTTNQNVVNYTVVIAAENKDNVLLPGMTATVDFVVDQRVDVLLAPNSALRFQPTEKELAQARQSMQKNMPPPPDSTRNEMRPPGGRDGRFGAPPAGGSAPPMPSGDMKMLWYLAKDGTLAMAPVKVGISDGTNTEIVGGGFLSAGMQVISGTATSSKSTTKSSTKTQSGGPGPPPMF
jgi:HlyD family secretion protein